MSNINRTNAFIERFFPLYILAMVAAGLSLSSYGSALAAWTVYGLAIQMFIMGLSVRLNALVEALKKPTYLLLWMALAWGLMPFLSFLLGRTFLSNHPEFAAGLILTTALPAAITSSVWTGITKGNLPLAITIVGTASVLSGVATPFLLTTWVGAFVEINAWELFLGFVTSVLLPTLLGVAVHEAFLERLDPFRPSLKLVVKLIIGALIFINAGVLKPHLETWGWTALGILGLVIVQAVLIYWLVLLVLYRIPAISRSDAVALTYATSMRNNSAGIVIGLTFFGPTVAAPVIISILMQQPLASLVHHFVFSSRRFATKGFSSPGENL